MLIINQPDPTIVAANVDIALAEDIQTEDLSAAILTEQRCSATIIARECGILAGKDWATLAFKSIDGNAEINWLVNDGDRFEAAQTLCRIDSVANKIVTAERTALNFLQCLSATATKVATINQLILDYPATLLDTRKTLPGLRYAQKYAVVCGGGTNHRMGLYDAFLIKENHIAQAGGIADVIAKARAYKAGSFIEIEVEDLHQCQLALEAQVDRIMLDNFSLSAIQEAMTLRTSIACTHIPFEVSGNITLQNIQDYAATGIEFISLGTLTKDIKAIDLSLLIETD